MYNYFTSKSGWARPRKPPSAMSNEEQMEWCSDIANTFDFCTRSEKDALARIMYKSVKMFHRNKVDNTPND